MKADEAALARGLELVPSAVGSAVRSIEGYAELCQGLLTPEQTGDAMLLAATRKLLRVHGTARAVERLRAAAAAMERCRPAPAADDVEGVPV